jgi:hypothetical protein
VQKGYRKMLVREESADNGRRALKKKDFGKRGV